MLGKRTRPLWKNSTKFGLMANTSKTSAIKFPSIHAITDQDGLKSPTSPLEMKSSSNSMKSPRGWQRKDSEGVGLGILAAMSNTNNSRDAIIASSISAIQAVPVKNFLASAPIPIVSAKASSKFGDTSFERELSESYTRVISHGGSNSVRKKEYFYEKNEAEAIDNQWRNSAVFFASPPRFQEAAFHSNDFLNDCYLCRKKLHGQDIYMYRGDKAFCSVECRYQQIMNDEYKEKCGSETVMERTSYSVSLCSAPRLFYAGVAVG